MSLYYNWFACTSLYPAWRCLKSGTAGGHLLFFTKSRAVNTRTEKLCFCSLLRQYVTTVAGREPCTVMLQWSNTAYPHAHITRGQESPVSHQTHTKGQTGKTGQIIIAKNWKQARNLDPGDAWNAESVALPVSAAGPCWCHNKKAKLLFIALYSCSIWCL